MERVMLCVRGRCSLVIPVSEGHSEEPSYVKKQGIGSKDNNKYASYSYYFVFSLYLLTVDSARSSNILFQSNTCQQ
jgi:hypothetical protein